jgi:hypothetical protein
MDETTASDNNQQRLSPNQAGVTVPSPYDDPEVERYINYYQQHIKANSPHTVQNDSSDQNHSRNMEQQLQEILNRQRIQQQQLAELKRQQQIQQSSINQSLNATSTINGGRSSPVKVSIEPNALSMRMSLNELRNDERESILKMLAKASKTDLLFTRGNSGEILVTYKVSEEQKDAKKNSPDTRPSTASSTLLSKDIKKDISMTSVSQPTPANVRSIDWLLRIIDDIYNNRYSVSAIDLISHCL